MTMLSSLDNIGVADAGLVAGLGYGVVFLGLIALMIVVIIIGKIFSVKKKEKTEEAAPVAAAPAAAPEAPAAPAAPAGPLAPGSAGQLKTYDVPPKTCAMLMAIVADKMGKPLNELRFISIKEVK